MSGSPFRILTAEMVYAAPLDRADLRGVPAVALPAILNVNAYAGRAMAVAELPTRELPEAAQAYINDGRWVADCPTDGCGGALLVSPADPRFLCPVCWQGWYRVEFPEKRVEIENLLTDRPGPGTRHWRPGETLADLVAENREMLGTP